MLIKTKYNRGWGNINESEFCQRTYRLFSLKSLIEKKDKLNEILLFTG